MRFQKTSVAFLLPVLAMLASCSGKEVQPVAGGRGSPAPFVGKFGVRQFKLDNGLKVFVVEDHSSPTFAYQTWFRVGSRDEVPGRTGLAHLFEHLMFKATRNFPEGQFDHLLEEAGVEGENAFTDRDLTAYVEELPSDRLDLAARLESDRMVNLTVNDESFRTEREVVQNERRQRTENSPDGTIRQELFGLAFKQHPYRWPVIGYAEDLERMTAKDAQAFYHAYYSPNHATIVVSGDIAPEQVYETILKYYAGIPAQPAPVQALGEEPPQNSVRKKVLRLNVDVEKLQLGWRSPPIDGKDMPALQIFQTILCSGKSSRLHNALVNSGISADVGCYFAETKDPSLWLVETNLQQGRKARQAEAVILKVIKEIRKSGPSTDELQGAKARLSFDFYEGLGGNMEKAAFIGKYETLAGNFQVGLEQFEKAKAVTGQDIQAVARRYFDPKDRTEVIGVPK